MEKRVFVWLILATLGVLLLTLLVYFPGLAGPFVLDDTENIVRAYIAQPDLSAVIYSITHNASGLFGRSVAAFSFVLSGLQYGIDPWGYKFHNLLIHLACGLLLFRLLAVVLPLLAQRPHSTNTLLIAGLVSSFWLLHPLLVSTVLYAVQRMTQLSALFIILALLSYLAMRQAPAASPRYWLHGWLLFPLWLLLAILSKEIGVLIPLYVLLFEVVVFRLTAGALRRNPYIAGWLLVFVLLPLLVGGIYFFTHLDVFTDYSNRTFTLSERLLTQVHVLFFYIRMILLPRVGSMGLFLEDIPLVETLDAATLLLIGVLLLAVTFIWWARRRFPVAAFGLGWFLVSHLLESTVIPLELVFEHRNYLAAAGLLLVPVYYICRHGAARGLQLFLLCFMVIILVQTWSRVQEWSNEDTLLSLAVADHPDSPRARTTYANFLFTQNHFAEAEEQLRAASLLSPENAGPVLHLLVMRCLQGDRNEDLLAESEVRLRSYPASVYALNSLDNLLGTISRGTCTLLTMDDFSRLVDAGLAMPDNQANALTKGYFRRFQGIHSLQTGFYAQGVIELREAHESSKLVTILGDLVTYQIAFGRLDDAADTLAYIEELNRATAGIENYLVNNLRDALAAARLPKPPSEMDGSDAVTDAMPPEADGAAMIVPAVPAI